MEACQNGTDPIGKKAGILAGRVKMGQSIRLTCDNCKSTYDLKIGQGRADGNIDRVLAYFDDATSNLIKEKLSVAGEQAVWNYRRMIGSCKACGSFSEIPTFSIRNNDKVYVTAGKCGCGSVCELIDDTDDSRMSKITCPKCGKTVSAEITGMWD